MIDKEDLLKTITEWNNVNENHGKPLRANYDEETNKVIMTAIGFSDFRREETPEHFYSGLRCSGWEYVSEEEKKIKNEK